MNSTTEGMQNEKWINEKHRKPGQLLKEKVLQFGTGVLLRALPDYLIDKANKQGIFNGSIVVVKSTLKSDANLFARQDNVYTVCSRGMINGILIEEYTVCSAISRVLDAHTQWDHVLQCAANPDLKIIISNTTERGIELVFEPVSGKPPVSFPAKLTSFLYERFKTFGGSADSGLVVIPLELIPDCGKLLLQYVVEIAKQHALPSSFVQWLKECNTFCNSLVDRIVPGMPDVETKTELERKVGYRDDLLVVAEPYRLWAVEGDDALKSILSFSTVDSGIIIDRDISLHRELKLRILNGTHTLFCGLAFLRQIEFVKDAMSNAAARQFITELMVKEIATSIPYAISEQQILTYIDGVKDRFSNPFIQHRWLAITAEYTSKMKMRCIPLLLEYYQQHNEVPTLFATCFAAYLRFMKVDRIEGTNFKGKYQNKEYDISDKWAPYFFETWQNNDIPEFVSSVLSDNSLWGVDLTAFAGFTDAVVHHLSTFAKE